MRVNIFITAIAFVFVLACTNEANEKKNDISTIRKLEGEELVKRGQYLVTIGGCNDCHSPKNFSPHGFTFDSTRLMSGHPAGTKLPPVDAKALTPGYWVLMSPDISAFVGPWGISYAANLTPDSTTGIGAWTEDNFMQALRKGKHMGMDNGRPIMPPMPWELIGKMTDEDLRAVFSYLKSLPAIKNSVPAPKPPNEAMAMK